MGDYRVSRDVTAGCHTCDGLFVTKWTGGNAQGVAARHARAHNHSTWVAVEMTIGYGPRYSDGLGEARQKTDTDAP